MEEGNVNETLLGPTQRLARDIGLRGVLKLWALGSLLGLAVTLAYLTQPAESTVYIATAENATFSFADADAAFGGLIPPNGLRGVPRRSSPLDGCGGLDISAAPGKVEFALIERGQCTFDEKVRNAQNAGFAAAIIFNNEPGRELITMSGRRTGEIYIPAVFVTYNSGRQLLSVIEQSGTICYISSTFENTAWSVMAVSFISLLAVSAVLATFFFVRRHRLRRIGSRLVLVRTEDAGMTAREVKALPSFTFSAATPGSGTSETCAICLEDYEAGEKLRVLPCRHEFHLACVDQWLTTRRPFCPVCKRDAHSTNPVPPPSESTPLLAPLLRPPTLVSSPSTLRGSTSATGPTPPHATVQIEGLEQASSTRSRGGASQARGESREAEGEIRGQAEPGEAAGVAIGGGERPALVAAATQTTASPP